MAQPARKIPQAADTPPIDPDAVARAYRLQRAKRRARLERTRERRLAGLRFAFVLLVLVALTIFLSLTIWKQVERLFGL
jgi:hypothetical protein